MITLAQRYAPGVVGITALALGPTQPGLALGYGVIDDDDIVASLQALRRALGEPGVTR